MLTGRLLDLQYGIEVDDPGLAAYLQEVLADSLEPGPAVTHFALVRTSTSSFEVRVDDTVVSSGTSPTWALSNLLWQLNRRTVASVEQHVVLHAAAVAADDQVVLIAGASGAGKSTAAIGLARSGLALISDDVVVIEPGGAVRGSRKPIGLRAGSRSLLLGPSWRPPEPPEPFRGLATHHVAASSLGVSYTTGSCRTRMIVFPEIERVSAGERRPKRSAALTDLVDHAFSLSSDAAAGFELLGRVVADGVVVAWPRGDVTTLRDLIARELLKS